MSSLCLKCKGKLLLCSRDGCPIYSRIESFKSMDDEISKSSTIYGASPPTVFVGRYGYPKVQIGPMVPPLSGEEGRKFDDPKGWYGKGIEEIINLRTKLVRSSFRTNVKNVRYPDKLLSLTQELAMSGYPVDMEVELKKPPKLRLVYDDMLSPMGPSGTVRDAELVQNPRVERAVDYLVSDHDVSASNALWELYRRNIDTYQMSRLLSAGLLGRDKDRKLVPTRWSITAVDSNLADCLKFKVKQHQQITEIQLFSAEYLGNHFEILTLPGPYSFELLEMWHPGSVWAGEKRSTQTIVDREERYRKSNYSSSGGGYYAVRLPVLEYLSDKKRQATVLAVREIFSDYWAPLGVWVVRETARHALAGSSRTFGSVEGALNEMASRLRVRREQWTSKSNILRDLLEQTKLESFTEGRR